MGFEDTITPLSPSGKICLGIYSRPGEGKTAFWGSSATQRVLILRPPTDHVDSIMTVWGPRPNVHERIMRDWRAMDDAANYLADMKDNPPYDWVVLDSISLWQDIGLDDIWAGVLASPKGPHRKVHGLDKGEYGTNMERIGQWVRRMIAIPGFNFGVTAHVTEVVDAETDELVMMPYVQGKDMAAKISGYMNIVGHLTTAQLKGKPVRVLRTKRHARYFAKDQFGVVGDLPNPTLDKIVELTQGKTPGKSTPRRKATRPRPTRRTAA